MAEAELAELARKPGVVQLLKALGEGNGRFVGGAVRDSLLSIPVQDLDVATPLSPYEVMRRCGAAGIKTIPTGIAHGTVTAVSSGQVVEVTTLRSDVETDGRHARVAFTDDWRADAERRDFTMNALYFDPVDGTLADYFGGLDDLAAGRVRFIGDPLQRIAEDHLRILRFFRFHARFGRGEMEPEGLQACLARSNDLMALSRERIADELLKLLALEDPTATVAIMIEGGVLGAVIPEIGSGAADRLGELVVAERAAGVASDPLRRLSALLPGDSSIARNIAARLKLSNRARKRLELATEPELSDDPRSLAYWIGTEAAVDRLLLQGDSAGAKAIADWEPPRLPIGGGALIAAGVPAGPGVAQALKRIEKRWVAAGYPSGTAFAQLVEEAVRDAAGN